LITIFVCTEKGERGEKIKRKERRNKRKICHLHVWELYTRHTTSLPDANNNTLDRGAHIHKGCMLDHAVENNSLK